MTHCTYRSRVRAGHQTVTGPVTPTCSWDRWGRAETERTALGEALVMRRRTRVRFPPPPPLSRAPRGRRPHGALARRDLVGEESGACEPTTGRAGCVASADSPEQLRSGRS